MYNYNYLIVNDELDQAIDEAAAIIIAEQKKITRNVDFYKNYIK